MSMTELAAPLEGVRVLDMGRVLAAPWAAQILGDLGADVIKIERPGSGDDARTFGPQAQGPDGEASSATAMYLAANRNKRSVTIDFSRPEGAALVRGIAATCDVLIENFRPGSLRRMGLDYASVRAANPGIIYCSVTGYGQEGPYAQRPGYDGVFQAQGGLMSVTGHPDDTPGAGPLKAGPSLVDITAGHIAVIGILAALRRRDLTGEGQQVDASLLDAVVSLQASHMQGYLVSGRLPRRAGNTGNGGHPAATFECADGAVYISAGSDAHYAALCEVLALPELATDARFATNPLRLTNREFWNAIAEPAIRRWTRNDLVEALVARGVPAGPVANYDEVFADPHVRARGIEVATPNPRDPATPLRMLGSPVRLSDSPVRYRRPPPDLGEHTEQVLMETMGLSREEVAAYRAAGFI
jgi:crotonobetainyl-CoA:carnitine CoA-transferase CaiB-like acyl-CoA transferase